jgi:hypothetical protein
MLFRKLFRKVVGAQGLTFGVMDGVITVLGVLTGLYVLGDRAVVIAGMLIAGLADSFANAAGIHVSQETEGEHGRGEVRMSTLMAFLSTFIVTLLLVLPHAFLSLYLAFLTSMILGLALIFGVGFFVGKRLRKGNKKTGKIMLEYFLIALVVIATSYLIALFVRSLIGVAYV